MGEELQEDEEGQQGVKEAGPLPNLFKPCRSEERSEAWKASTLWGTQSAWGTNKPLRPGSIRWLGSRWKQDWRLWGQDWQHGGQFGWWR